MDLDDNAEPPRDSEQSLEVTTCHGAVRPSAAKSKCHTGHKKIEFEGHGGLRSAPRSALNFMFSATEMPRFTLLQLLDSTNSNS